MLESFSRMTINAYQNLSDLYWQYSYTNIHDAASDGNIPAVHAFMNAGITLEVRDQNGDTPLHNAAYCGHEAMVRTLIELGADKEAKEEIGYTPLHCSARYGYDTVVRILIDAGADKEVREQVGLTPLHIAAFFGHDTVVRILIDAGADKEARSQRGHTPLHCAVSVGNEAVVRTLINAGVNIHTPINEGGGETAIVLAFEHGHHNIVEYLQQQGAVLPERFQAGANHINENQSVHAVHDGVSVAAKALQKKYASNSGDAKVTQAISDLKAFLDRLPYDSTIDSIANKNGAAQRCITWLLGVDFTDLRSDVTLTEAMALVWMALTDEKEIDRKREERSISEAEKNLSPEELEEKLTAEERASLAQIIAQWLYEIKRGYNLSEGGNDNGLTDSPICTSGAFNKTIYTLNGRHSLVSIPYVTNLTITEKAKKIVGEIFDSLEEDNKKRYAKEFDGSSLSGDLLVTIYNKLGIRLHAEYDSFNSAELNVKKIIDDILDSLQYMPPQSLIELKAALDEEASEEEISEVPEASTSRQRLRPR